MLRQFLASLFMLIQIFILNVHNSAADEPEKVEKVIVTGMGINADKARQNAIRNAVEQVVGTYVSSDTMVEDSQLIKDEILSFSGGYVKESKILSTDKDDDLVKVKLEALVVATKLKRKIQALNITVKDIDGDSLFGEAVSKNDANVKAAALLNKIMSNYPQAAYNITIGKPEITSTDNDNNQVNISVPTTIKWDKSYLNELKSVLSHIAKINFKYGDFNKYYAETTKAIPGENGQTHVGICFVTKNSISRNILDDCYILDIFQLYSIPRENWAFSRYVSEKKINYGLIKRQHDLKFMFTFISKSNEELFTIPYAYYENIDGEADNCSKQGLRNVDNTMCYNDGYRSLPNLFPSSDGMSANSLLLTDGVFGFNAILPINTDLLNQIKSIKVSIESWQM